MVEFVHLHVHSEYSIVDGMVRLDELVELVAAQNNFAVAVTDQSNLFAMVKFYQAAHAAKIKPIIGTDILVENSADPFKPHRLILLCQNEIGFRNLTEIVSRSYIEGQGLNQGLSQGKSNSNVQNQSQNLGKPIAKKEWIHTKNQGLIAISVSLEGDIAEALLSENQTLAMDCVKEWTTVFGDRFYIEVTRTGHSEENTYLKAVIRLAQTTECPLVATNKVRFLEREDFEAHEARICIHEGMTLNDPSRKKVYTEEQYLKSPDEMKELFADLPEALENSVQIAFRCNLELKLGQVFLPKYPVPQGKTTESYLKEQAFVGLQERLAHLPKIPDVYVERLETEISVINSMGFAGYFLIVADFIRWAKEMVFL